MNRDDDFFKLPKARNPLRREPNADAPKPEAPAQKPSAPVPPIVSAEPTARAMPAPRSEPPLAAKTPVRAPPVAPKTDTPAPVSTPTEPVARNPLRRDPAPSAAPTSKPSAQAPAAPPRAATIARAAATSPPPPPPPRAQKKARRLWLWPLFGAGALGLVLVGGMIGYWVFMNVAARLIVTNQPLTIALPKQADIKLRSKNKIDILMKGVIYAQVPLKQTLNLPVKGTYNTIVDIDTQVPLETVITYEGVIPVDSMADIEARAPVNFQNVKKYKNLHFKAKLPLKLNLPVKLVVPVKQSIHLKYKGPLKVQIDHVIRAPVDTVLKTALKVNQRFSVPVTSTLLLRAQLPQHPVKATIVEADLFLNLATLKLEKKKDAQPAQPTPAPAL